MLLTIQQFSEKEHYEIRDKGASHEPVTSGETVSGFGSARDGDVMG